jgi:plasmid replication initiation protein
MNDLVFKKNPLVESKYKLNPLELKVILSVISLIDKDDSDFWTYQLRAKDLADYKELKRACKSLMTKVFEIETDRGWLMLNWFSSIEYVSKSGVIECAFDPKLKPYLLQIKDNFTAYTLKSVLPMRSAYSIRIYELLKQYEVIGSRVFDLEDLQNILKVPKSYRIWRDFEKRVLIPAKKEINKHSDLKITYEPIKQGRKYTAVSFKIAPNLQKMPLKQYKALVRSKCVGKTLLRTKDKETGKKIELSVSEKGYLYNKLDPDWKITHKRADDIWKLLQSEGLCL